MVKMQMAMSLLSALLLWSCGGGAVEDAAVAEVEFQRRGFEERVFKGRVAQAPVRATLSLKGDRLQGELLFEETGALRRIDARMSYEGLVRGNVLAAKPDSVEEPPGYVESGNARAAEMKAVMLTQEGIAGTYQSSLRAEPDFMLLQAAGDSLVEVRSNAGADSLEWRHWMRRITCVKGGSDTTASIALRIPLLQGPQSEDILLPIFVQTLFALTYEERCTCQSLEEKQIQQLQVDFANVGAEAERAALVITASSDGLPYFQKNLRFNLKTGSIAPPPPPAFP